MWSKRGAQGDAFKCASNWFWLDNKNSLVKHYDNSLNQLKTANPNRQPMGLYPGALIGRIFASQIWGLIVGRGGGGAVLSEFYGIAVCAFFGWVP